MSVYLVQVIEGLSLGATLFLVAAGLTLIFGAMRVVNFAHGSFFMLGAFLAVSIGERIGTTNITFWISILLAALGVAIVGIAVEVLLLRPIYGRPMLTQLIVTFGLVLVIGGLLRIIYGPVPHRAGRPDLLSGSVSLLDRQLPVYHLFIVSLAVAVGVLLWLILQRSGLGQKIRAAVSDRELLALSGVNVRLLFTGVFALGSFLAGLAGAAITPRRTVRVGIDVEVIVEAFVVVVIGGLGSVGGAAVGAVLVGVAKALGILWMPQVALAIPFAVLVLVLAIRPQGLFGGRGM